jgi:hypothetical protein
VPVVELGNNFYQHPEFGKTYVPTLFIAGWLDEHGQPVGEPDPAQVAAPEPAQPAPQQRQAAQPASPGRHAPRF